MTYGFGKEIKTRKDKNVLCSLQEQLGAWLEFLDVLFSFFLAQFVGAHTRSCSHAAGARLRFSPR